MQFSRNQFLSGPAFATDQNGQVSFGGTVDLSKQSLHRSTGSTDCPERRTTLRKLLSKGVHLMLKTQSVLRAFDDGSQMVDIKRLR